MWRDGWGGWGAAALAQAQEGAPGKKRRRRIPPCSGLNHTPPGLQIKQNTDV